MTEQERAVLQAAEAYVETRQQQPAGDDEAGWARYGTDLRIAWLRLKNAVEQKQAVHGPGGQR